MTEKQGNREGNGMSPDESNAVIQRNGEIVVMTIDEVRAEIVSQYGVGSIGKMRHLF